MQTSIEWLWEQIPFEFTSKRSAFEVFEQAKKMHEREMKKCWQDGFRFDSKYKNFKEYYQETFKKD
jgi:hypothetical protein